MRKFWLFSMELSLTKYCKNINLCLLPNVNGVGYMRKEIKGCQSIGGNLI